MRTKTLLLTAAVIAAGITASQAQVYSVNAVGYINVSIPQGYKIVANQLNSTNNTIPELFPSVPNGFTVLKWAGSSFLINQYDADFAEWQDPNQTLSPGEGAFVFNPSTTPVTVTFVGEVPQGTLVNTIPHLYSMQSSKVPQAGLLSTALGYTPSPGDQVLRYINGGYLIYTFDPDFQEWDAEPTLNVGEGFFLLRNAAGSTSWTRQFSVN